MSTARQLRYWEYVQTPQWKERANHMRARAGHRCQICNSRKGPLDVHHRCYDDVGEEDNRDLVVLCRECHDLFHAHGKLVRG